MALFFTDTKSITNNNFNLTETSCGNNIKTTTATKLPISNAEIYCAFLHYFLH